MRRVLIAHRQDEAEALSLLFERLGEWDVTQAHSQNDAIKILKQNEPFELAIIGANVPGPVDGRSGVDGATLIDFMHTQGSKHVPTPVIVVSGNPLTAETIAKERPGVINTEIITFAREQPAKVVIERALAYRPVTGRMHYSSHRPETC